MEARKDMQPLAHYICAVTAANPDLLERAPGLLSKLLGPLLAAGPVHDFDHFTDYYGPEMGSGLVKQLLVFLRPRAVADLPRIKLASNALEQVHCRGDGGRTLNLDPGYLTLSRLVLASTKDHAHRLYLGQGIFGELTLQYHSGSYRPLAWTYPDYSDEAMLAFLNGLRPQLKTGQDLRGELLG